MRGFFQPLVWDLDDRKQCGERCKQQCYEEEDANKPSARKLGEYLGHNHED